MEMLRYFLPFCLYVFPAYLELSTPQSLAYMLVCTAKGVLALGALIAFRKTYPKFSTQGFSLAVVAGIIGFAIWIGLDWVQSSIPFLRDSIQYVQGVRAGFNPFADGFPTRLQLAFIAVRLIELTLVVPLAEEVFWRGFLSRYLISDDFQRVPQGTFTLSSFAIVVLMFTSVHPEILSALVWGCLINLLYMRTRNLWACVVMHSVTNAMLGVYVLTTQQWHLW